MAAIVGARSNGRERRRRNGCSTGARRAAENGAIATPAGLPAARHELHAEQLFTDARTHNGFTDEPVGRRRSCAQIYDLMKWAPTSANSSPARIVFVTLAGGQGEAARVRLARQRREDARRRR